MQTVLEEDLKNCSSQRFFNLSCCKENREAKVFSSSFSVKSFRPEGKGERSAYASQVGGRLYREALHYHNKDLEASQEAGHACGKGEAHR